MQVGLTKQGIKQSICRSIEGCQQLKKIPDLGSAKIRDSRSGCVRRKIFLIQTGIIVGSEADLLGDLS